MIEFQRLLLGDPVRNDAFFRALQTLIRPDRTTVADIGSGTGFLGFLAEKLGARECFLYEMSDLLDMSKKIAEENGIERCKFFRKHSTEVRRPPKVDLVVSETLGNYALEENIIETLNDARRFLKPGGTVVPQELRQFVAPVTSSRLYDELDVWDAIGFDLDYSHAKEICMNNVYVRDIEPTDLPDPDLAIRTWDHVDFREENASVRESEVEWTVDEDALLFGFALWWEATLAPGVTLSTSPFDPPTHWKQSYLPVMRPLPVSKGQKIRLMIHSDSRYAVNIRVKWTTSIISASGKTLSTTEQDMWKGHVE